MTYLWGVQSEKIDEVWPQASKFIDRVVDKGADKTTNEIYEGLKNRQYQLWIAWDEEVRACCVTQTISMEPDGVLCSILMCAGNNIARWIRHIKTIEDWAKSKECFAIELVGRKGWKKYLDYKITGNF